MKTLARGLLMSAMLAGCIEPPMAPPLTGGTVTTGDEAKALVAQAGVVPLDIFFMARGNGVFVGDDQLLSAQHVIGRPEYSYIVASQNTPLEIVQAGDRTKVDGDWAIAQTRLPKPVQPCQLARASSIQPGQDAMVVGYWNVPGDTRSQPVTVAGRIIEMPEVFRHGSGELVGLDLGPNVTRYNGLSGSPVLVKDLETGEWQLAGIYAKTITSDRGEEICGFVPLSLMH